MTARVIVDQTHCGRHVTGLERISLELFSPQALAPLAVETVRAAGRKGMMLKQNLALPLMMLRDRRAVMLCPGFPPSPLLQLAGGDRVVPYIHDLFLLTRPQDLNIRAKLYMVAPFRSIVRRAALMLVNSQATADELRRFCRPDAEILLYRPAVRNVFCVSAAAREGPAACASSPSAPSSRARTCSPPPPSSRRYAAPAIPRRRSTSSGGPAGASTSRRWPGRPA